VVRPGVNTDGGLIVHLSKITIENFRGIKHVEVEFERDVTVIVGENNAGKTSVLEALRLCLDIVKSDKTCNFSEFDFYRDENRKEIASCEPISITLSFLESEDYLWPEHITQTLNEVIVGSDFSAIKFRVTAHFDADAGELTQSWCFLDDVNNEMVGRTGLIKDLRRLRPFFFQTALRAAKEQFHGQSTYWSSFLRNKDIDDATRRDLEEELHQVNQKIVNAHSSFKDVTEEVKRISNLVTVGQADAVTVDPSPADVYKALRYTDVNLLTASNAKIPIRSHGEGTQSLSVLLLFSAYLKTRLKADVDRQAEPIITIEEPEAHLHPNAARAVWHLLHDLPGQKILATHSGDILSEVPVPKLRRMSRAGNVTKCKSIPDGLLTVEELRKFNHHVRRNRGELLFARCWLLVEGETDVSAFVECADQLNIDLHAKGIRIVEYSQAGGPSIFIKVADALGIDWHLVADSDPGGKKYIEAAKILLNGRSEASHISSLTHSNIEILLCSCGYGQPYRDGVGPQKEADLENLEINSPEYWEKVYKIVNKSRYFSKPAAAMEAILLMREQGEAGVPIEVTAILKKVGSSVGRTQ
jgi:putative ATP-dependent endonuclease of the OLD family